MRLSGFRIGGGNTIAITGLGGSGGTTFGPDLDRVGVVG